MTPTRYLSVNGFSGSSDIRVLTLVLPKHVQEVTFLTSHLFFTGRSGHPHYQVPVGSIGSSLSLFTSRVVSDPRFLRSHPSLPRSYRSPSSMSLLEDSSIL